MRSPLTKERDRAIAILFYATVVFLGYLFVSILTPFFAPLGWAVVLAIFVYPGTKRSFRDSVMRALRQSAHLS